MGKNRGWLVVGLVWVVHLAMWISFWALVVLSCDKLSCPCRAMLPLLLPLLLLMLLLLLLLLMGLLEVLLLLLVVLVLLLVLVLVLMVLLSVADVVADGEDDNDGCCCGCCDCCNNLSPDSVKEVGEVHDDPSPSSDTSSV